MKSGNTGKNPGDRQNANVLLIFKKGKIQVKAVNPLSAPSKIRERLTLEIIGKGGKDRMQFMPADILFMKNRLSNKPDFTL